MGKIPKDAKKVFDGVVFDVYQWQQEMYDGSYSTFEKLRRYDTSQIIPVTKDNNILLLEQEQPGEKSFIGLPGGRADSYDEDPLDLAKRELLEETGYKSNDWTLFMSIEPFTKVEWTIYTYIARGCEKVQDQNLDSGEKMKLIEVTFEEFVDIVFDENFRDDELFREFAMAKIEGRMEELKLKILG